MSLRIDEALNRALPVIRRNGEQLGQLDADAKHDPFPPLTLRVCRSESGLRSHVSLAGLLRSE